MRISDWSSDVCSSDLPGQRFNSGRRSDFRRARRRAEAMDRVSFEMHAPSPETFDRLFAEAVAVEQRGWKGESGTALGSDPVKGAFFHDFLHRMSQEDRKSTRLNSSH